MRKLLIFFLSLLWFSTTHAMQLESSAFNSGEEIPSTYTCEGANISPELHWSVVPTKTQSLALIVADPDVPAGTWYHWLIFNIPVSATHFKEDVKLTPIEATVAKNSYGKNRYEGPCPPRGTHHYYFTLYALDSNLSLNNKADYSAIKSAMAHHILATAELMGTVTKELPLPPDSN